ncbi:hypothetical protein J2T50_001489 [Streptococcus gallinaceus]|nr:hypothetical protein [Streptococcus gallinaceus]MCP1770563.1 hypothetical protein [Streptococcus gallinaceus]CRH91414.1 Uncharacterised protein [Chlamydia trachomatis]
MRSHFIFEEKVSYSQNYVTEPEIIPRQAGFYF